jgi:hypothetical protein
MLDTLTSYLSIMEVPCQKYIYTFGSRKVIFDKYQGTLKISKDGSKLIIHTFKPVEDLESANRKAALIRKKQKLLARYNAKG